MKSIRTYGIWKWSIGLLALLAVFAAPVSAQKNPEAVTEEIRQLKDRIEKLEKDNKWNTEDIDSLLDRVDATEMHTATDTLAFDVEFRTRAESIHYKDLRMAPPELISLFFTGVDPANPARSGFNGATLTQIRQGIANMAGDGNIPAPNEYDADNDVIYTNKLRLNMFARFNPHLDFQGRLAAYKVFGDSTGVKFNRGGVDDITLDGTTASRPGGDTIHLERAYFVYRNDIANVPVSFSVGRRPSTQGPPLEYRNFTEVGGSPVSTIINWQFDGASLSFGLEDTIGIPGASFKLCYGVGFENDWGNSTALSPSSDLEDVHMLGFISNFYDNGTTSLMFNYAHAREITDGFAGTTVMPFTVARQDRDGDGTPEYYFSQNTGGFVSRLEPASNIGDWDAASLLLRSQLRTPNDHVDWFIAGSWSHTDPSQISENPFFEMMGMGLLSSNGELESRDGYSVYAGMIFPMPHDARFGVEYNWGSKYWFNFTGAEDSLIGSKLAARGQVFETYYHQPIYGPNFFVTLGGQYYDYKYTGSGNPLGKPVEIDKANALDAINPVADEVWNAYLSATVNF